MTLCVDVLPGTVGNTLVKGGTAQGYVLIPNQLPFDQCTGYLLMDKTDAIHWALRFEQEYYMLGFGTLVLFFVLGLGIGMVVNIVRKARTP